MLCFAGGFYLGSLLVLLLDVAADVAAEGAVDVEVAATMDAMADVITDAMTGATMAVVATSDVDVSVAAMETVTTVNTKTTAHI